ncbi:MAG: YtfJ family protein [Melioribacteraceae bacterium]|nr:YtfJ family protein [Melioribacteraceae bacterium]MCF8354122.1 YtfJ family protein [Melioribacteraceae bacterium]MCF8393349.1 YtfJ family protein [Melioribacteraceae bacterium]MCF8418914.1 YtfJ family protein [Melioribacteraceae bacterium]
MRINKNHNFIKTISRLVIMIFFLSLSVSAQVEINKNPPEVFLDKENGGNIDGYSWSSKELKGKINLLLYVAPDQQGSVQKFLERIDKRNYQKERFQVTLILNTEATWIPNSLIEDKVRGKAEEDTTKIYVLDKDEVVLNEWNLSEDNPNILLINDGGLVVFLYSDELNEEVENELLSRIELQINKGESK